MCTRTSVYADTLYIVRPYTRSIVYACAAMLIYLPHRARFSSTQLFQVRAALPELGGDGASAKHTTGFLLALVYAYKGTTAFAPSKRGGASLHFHSLKGRFGCGVPEVADSLAPGFTAVDAIVLYFQSTVIFPSWTSPVRPRSPAPIFHILRNPHQ
jgi:hypothetical protein